MPVSPGPNATAVTQLVCPVSGSPTGAPVAGSHTRTVRSFPALADQGPVGPGRRTHRAHPAGVPGEAGHRPGCRWPGPTPAPCHRPRRRPSSRPIGRRRRHTPDTGRCGRSVGPRPGCRWPGPTPAPCHRSRRRPAASARQPRSRDSAPRRTPRRCARSVDHRSGCRSPGSHNRTVRIVPAQRETRVPVGPGSRHHRVHLAGVPGQRVADRGAGARVPQPHRAIGPGGGQTRWSRRPGARRTADTQPVCPVSGSPTGVPVPGSHNRTVPSLPALANQPVPSGWVPNTPRAPIVCPVSGSPTWCRCPIPTPAPWRRPRRWPDQVVPSPWGSAHTAV